MARLFKKLELEWKIILLAGLLFIAFLVPVQQMYMGRMQTLLEQSRNPQLEPVLRSHLSGQQKKADTAILASIERQRQWQAMIPVIMDEQRRAIRWFSTGLFVFFIGIALYVIKRLTGPLRNLSVAAEKIGKGKPAEITPASGGALGKLEMAMLHMQKELKSFRERAQAEGMEMAWRDIARVMAHEIKNPLTPIRLTLDRMNEKIGAGETLSRGEQEKHLDRIGQQIEHLESLVNEFRSFAREPEVSLQTVRLAPLVEGIAQDMRPLLATTVTGDAEAWADPRLVNQILLNLWKNAAEAGATTARVTIEQTGDAAVIMVADNGPGIPQDRLERVWIPYVTFKKGGTGLGLPVVKRLVEAMQGSITLASTCGSADHGVTVTCSFPRKSTVTQL